MPRPLGVAEAIIMCLFAGLFRAIANGSLSALTPYLDEPTLALMAQSLGWLGIFLVVFTRSKGRWPWQSLCRPGPLRVYLPVMGASFGVVVLLVALVPWVPADSLQKMDESGRGPGWAGFVSGIVVAPLAEECFFRGWMLGGLAKRYSRTFAVLVSSFLFGLIHVAPSQILMTAAMGLLFGTLFLITGSLIPSILAHCTANLTTVFLLTPLLQLLGYTQAELRLLTRAPAPMLIVGLVVTSIGVGALYWLFLPPTQGRTRDRKVGHDAES